MLREVPDHLFAAVTSGQMRVYGSVVRSVANGQIAGFLQETGGIGSVVPLVSPLTSLVNVAGHAASIYQNEQIKAAVATVQHLQVANLALGAVGIGVSIAGFAILNARIGTVERKVDALGDRLDAIARGIEALSRDRIADDFTLLRTLAHQLDEAWNLPDPNPQWQSVALGAHILADRFVQRASEVLDASKSDMLAAEPLLDAVALATAVRVTARLAAGEDLVALQAALSGSRTLVQLGGKLRLGELAFARISADGVEPATPQWGQALEKATDALRPTVIAARAREAAAASTGETLEQLYRQGISGRDWIAAARDEKEQPLLCLLPAPV